MSIWGVVPRGDIIKLQDRVTVRHFVQRRFNHKDGMLQSEHPHSSNQPQVIGDYLVNLVRNLPLAEHLIFSVCIQRRLSIVVSGRGQEVVPVSRKYEVNIASLDRLAGGAFVD